MSDLIKAIHRYRIEHGVSMMDLSKMCGVSYPTIQRICAGKSKANCLTEGKIRKVVGEDD